MRVQLLPAMHVDEHRRFMEVVMDKLQFVVPVRIVVEAGGPVVEIYDVDEALTFLKNWPVGRQGPVFRTAMNCCFSAKNNLMSAENARKSFAGFARITGILARDLPDAVVVDRDGEVRPLP